jgi:hypothetical protein
MSTGRMSKSLIVWDAGTMDESTIVWKVGEKTMEA